MIQPQEIRSTPVAATAGAVSRVIRPEASVTARPSTIATARRRVSGVHVVEQHGVDPDLQRLGELVEGVDLELDLDEVPGMAPRPLERRAHAARQCHVVVLDQHRVVEAETVVGAAAEPNRVFFERPQARRGLAGADDLGLVAGNRIGQRARRRGDPGHLAKEVERSAFGAQHPPRPAADPGNHVAARNPVPVCTKPLDPDCRVGQLEGEQRRIEAGDDTRLARRDDRLDRRLLRHHRFGRDVAGPTQILEQCRPDNRFDQAVASSICPSPSR